VARDKKQYQEICTRIHQVLIEQDTAHKKDRRTSSIKNSRRTIVGNWYWYWYNWATPKIKWQRCSSGYCRLIHQKDQTQSNNYSSLIRRYMSGTVHTGVEVHRMDSEMSGLVKRPWLQLMYCAICLLHGRNFRWREEVRDGSECWMVCCCWTPEIEFNKRLSSLIIRLVNYNVTTSLIYKLIV